jgi:hypothetical protein
LILERQEPELFKSLDSCPTILLKKNCTRDGGQKHVGLDVPVDVVVTVWLQWRPGAADRLQRRQLVRRPAANVIKLFKVVSYKFL